jgi:hypothetical protein
VSSHEHANILGKLSAISHHPRGKGRLSDHSHEGGEDHSLLSPFVSYFHLPFVSVSIHHTGEIEASCNECFLQVELKRWVCQGPWVVEEAGCQALCEPSLQVREVLSKRGCQARKHSLQVRELLGIVFPKCQLQLQGSETSCLACC